MSHDNEKSVAPEQEQISSRPASSDLEKKAGDIQPSTDPSLIEAIGAGSSDGNNLEASGPATKPESIRRQPVKVPRFKRRGLFGGFTVIAEVEEPKDYPDRIKWVITSVVGTAAVAAPLGSTIIFRESSTAANICTGDYLCPLQLPYPESLSTFIPTEK